MNTKLIVATIVAVVVIAAAIALLWQRPPPAGQPTAPPQATQKTQTTTGQQTTPPPQTTTQTQTTTKVTTTSAQTTTERVPWAGLKGDILGGGSTFVNPQMQKWSRDFLAATKGGVRVNYQSIGSGAGAAQFIAGKLDFGASDVPMPRDRYLNISGKFVQFPVVIGSIVVVYNVPEIAFEKTGKYLRLTGDVIADIYMGKIEKWCDERIKQLNPDLADKLPCRDIIGVHRSDGSGTTAAFTLWLSKVSREWNSTVGWGYTVKWPRDDLGLGIGAKGNEGVAKAVLDTPYSIGYIEYAYWWANKKTYDQKGGVAELYNRNDGQWHLPSVESVQLGASSGLQRVAQKLGRYPDPREDWNPISIEFSDPPKGYPIMAFVYVFLWTDYPQDKAQLLRGFFYWVLTEGQKPEHIVEGYIPLPKELAEIGLKALELVK
ncbi:phosphate ABC transporter substrate-binding protein, PhoT family [Pyrobaculum calidifontis JCM 11548]|uniref:Phosphate ABC transporter substrate-binding protein, PhoT family n=2 Tax=Pyrobaculum calidifontis TaxID=181486 RepID=A3MXD1_PYRCJ|nr:phosphate ABC transporter substrate-binding protein, PhoT family [Pyrobaculum calidifontis JCM 11548]